MTEQNKNAKVIFPSGSIVMKIISTIYLHIQYSKNCADDFPCSISFVPNTLENRQVPSLSLFYY